MNYLRLCTTCTLADAAVLGASACTLPTVIVVVVVVVLLVGLSTLDQEHVLSVYMTSARSAAGGEVT